MPNYIWDHEQCLEFAQHLRRRHADLGATELACKLLNGDLLSGRFDDPEAMARACGEILEAEAIYYGLNPVGAGRLSVTNAFQPGSRAGKDDITAIKHLLIDLDVVTPGRKQAATIAKVKKASCTDAEHDLAVHAAHAVKDRFFSGGWVIGTNGAQLIVPVDVVGTSDELKLWAEHNAKPMLREIATWLAEQPEFRGKITVDAGRWGLPQLAALPGTWKRNGPHTRERHHRVVRILTHGEAVGRPADNARIMAPVQPTGARQSRPRQADRHQQQSVPTETAELEALDCLCPGWNAVLLTADAHPVEGRSSVIYGLAKKLDQEGVHPDDIVSIVLAHDAVLGRKLVDRLHAEHYIENAIQSDGQVPGCTWVLEVNGCADPCVGCLRYRPTVQAPKSYRLFSAAAPPSAGFGDLDAARDQIANVIENYLIDGIGRVTLLVMGPPGLGKTSGAAVVVGGLFRHGRRFTLVVDRLDLADELAQRIGRPDRVRVIRGMQQHDGAQPMCLAPERYRDVESAGLTGMQGALACTDCPHAGTCPYTAQFRDTDKTWIMTASMMSYRLRNGTFDNDPHLVVLDEGALSAQTNDSWVVDERAVHMAVAAGLNVQFLIDVLRSRTEGVVMAVARHLAQASRHLQELYDLLRQAHDINADPDARRGLRLVPMPIIQLLVVLTQMLRHHGPNSRLERVGNTVVVRNPRDLRISAPTVVLDSTGHPDVYVQAIGRPVLTVNPQVRSNATILQLTTGRYGKSSLERQATRQKLFADVVEIVRTFGTPVEPVAVVTLMRYEVELTNRLTGLHATTLHYAATRGTNSVIDRGCRHIVLAGSYIPNIDALVAWARARAWQDDNAIDDRIHEVLEPLGTSGLAVPVLHAVDPRVDMWLQMLSAGEMLQAAERLRTRIRTGPLFVWILSNQPIPGLPPDHVADTVAQLIALATKAP